MNLQRKISFLTTLLFLSSSVKADVSEILYEGAAFVDNAITYTAVQDGLLRAEPNQKAKVVEKLNIGYPIVVQSKKEQTLTVGGYQDSWYKVKGEEGLKGYMWGGLLAKSWAYLPSGRLFLLAPLDSKTWKATILMEGAVESEFVFDDGLGAIDSEGILNYSVAKTELYSSAGFEPNIDLVGVELSYAACDYASGELMFYYSADTKKLGLAAKRTFSVGEAGYEESRFVLPSGEGGLKNELSIISKIVNLDENDPEKVKSEETTKTKYLWTGKEFQEKR